LKGKARCPRNRRSSNSSSTPGRSRGTRTRSATRRSLIWRSLLLTPPRKYSRSSTAAAPRRTPRGPWSKGRLSGSRVAWFTMSPGLISRNPDLKRLRDEGFEIEVHNGYLLIGHVPYVKAGKQVDYGTLASHLDFAG